MTRISRTNLADLGAKPGDLVACDWTDGTSRVCYIAGDTGKVGRFGYWRGIAPEFHHEVTGCFRIVNPQVAPIAEAEVQGYARGTETAAVLSASRVAEAEARGYAKGIEDAAAMVERAPGSVDDRQELASAIRALAQKGDSHD